jgi:fructoselysine 6-phosphate deglycase/fructoselysine-6-phosphate deglycase
MTNASSTPISITPDFYETLGDVVKQAPTALELSRRVRKDGLRSVYLVGCGGSHFAAFPGYDILLREATDLIVHHLTSAQFASRPPSACDKSSLVVAASHSGATPETVEAARAAKSTGATVAAITRRGDSPLRQLADVVFDYPSDVTVNESKTIHFAQLALALLEAGGGTNVAREAFAALPAALLQLKTECEALGKRVGELIAGTDLVYTVAAGGAFGAAAALAGCYLQEMQWLHAAAIDAGDFFHGPFEVVTDETVVVVFIGEDETRQLGERVANFTQRYSSRVMVIDSRQFTLPGISEEQRGLVGSIALASAARRLLDFISVARHHDTAQRRYMYKVDY